MNVEIKIPAMGESVTEAIVGRIIKQHGDQVKQDEEIVELETDKVNQVIYAPQAGKLSLKVKEGQKVTIGEVIGAVEGAAVAEVKPQVKAQPVQEDTSSRLSKSDYLVSLEKAAPAPAKIEVKEHRETRKRMSNIRRMIADKMVQVQATTASLTTFNEVDMTALIELRQKHKEEFQQKHGVKLGLLSFFIKAVVQALHAVPGLNSYIDGDEIVERHYCDIGVAVSTEKGLFVPVVRGCESLSFAQIEHAIEDYATKARKGGLIVDDLKGGCFTVTNGGVFGSLLSTPILNPPQTGILGMHKTEKRAVVINDKVEIRSMMYLALTYDHRVVDGKEAVTFLVNVKNEIEDPSRLLLDV